MKVLIADDDPHTRQGLVMIFEAEGYQVVAAENGSQAIEMWREEHPDVVCLDIMMPDHSGYEVCREIRKQDEDIPVLFISAKSEEVDKVLGLELGADDFIVKPFGVKEVVARVRAVTRRCFAMHSSTDRHAFEMGDLRVVPSELRAYRDGEAAAMELSLRDVKILRCLFERRGQVVDRDQLFNAGWGIDHMANSRSLDQHISQLRKRVERDPKSPEIIRTVHGAGYRFEGN